MANSMLETRKYTFTVEGETEMWYLNWLKDMINSEGQRKFNVSIEVKVQQSPIDFVKKITKLSTPKVTHLCDLESNSKEHSDNFKNVLSELKNSSKQKKIQYCLGYSNFSFELWIVLHKIKCGSFCDRTKYIACINKAYNKKYKNLREYKQESEFKKCLSQLNLSDVKKAIERAEQIMKEKKDLDCRKIQYKGFVYFIDNPSITVHLAIKEILADCGLY